MNSNSKWMLYGAYGYTGKLLLEEATRRGHTPIIAGRSEKNFQNLVKSLMLKKLQ